jgi:hypothetical protein
MTFDEVKNNVLAERCRRRWWCGNGDGGVKGERGERETLTCAPMVVPMHGPFPWNVGRRQLRGEKFPTLARNVTCLFFQFHSKPHSTLVSVSPPSHIKPCHHLLFCTFTDAPHLPHVMVAARDILPYALGMLQQTWHRQCQRFLCSNPKPRCAISARACRRLCRVP